MMTMNGGQGGIRVRISMLHHQLKSATEGRRTEIHTNYVGKQPIIPV